MNKTVKKISAVLLAFALADLAVSPVCYAEGGISDATSGKCGDGLSWELSDDGVLTISGSGEMYDYANTSDNYAPWSSYHNAKYKIIIEEGVSSIGSYAFENCTSVTDITIPNSVTSIGEYAFYRCTSLESITVPAGVAEIGNNAFYYCTALNRITISDGVLSIGKNAFTGCSSLKSVTIPGSVTEIGDGAFVGCESLTAVYAVDNSVYASEDGVLTSKDGSELIYYPVGKTDSSYIAPDRVTSIGAYSFENNTHLTKVALHSGITSIGAYAFEGCTSLSAVTLSEGLTSIGDQAFYGCTSLESITIPDSVTLLGKSVFTNCTALTDITLSENLSLIYDMTFYGCTSLSNIIISQGVTEIGDKAFANCTNLTDITIPGSVTRIGSEAFSDTGIQRVNYEGTIEQWEEIDMGLYNDRVVEADIVYEPSRESADKIVRVVIGSEVVTVETDGNESTYTMDTAPYIQPESSSTLVPLRFVAVAIYGEGVDSADSSDLITWDAAAKTASINLNNKIISFTAGNDFMTVNGENILMSNGVKAEITDGRMFIPFRALGEALNVSVDWENATKTAIYLSNN